MKLNGCLVAGLVLVGCGGGGSDDDDDPDTTTFTIPVGSMVANVPLSANAPTQQTYSFDLGDLAKPVNVTVDLEATLPNMTVVRTDGGGSSDPVMLDITVRIADAENAGTVCQDGVMAAQASVMADADFMPTAVAPATLQTNGTSIEAVQARSGALCVEGLASVDAMVSLSELVLSVTEDRNCDMPAAIAGTWTGDYSCDDSCGDDGSGTVTLTIAQRGHLAGYIDDGEATYQGTVCGNEFTFDGGGPGYTEGGVFTLNADGTASKVSMYQNTTDSCSGDCTDSLTRVNAGPHRPALGELGMWRAAVGAVASWVPQVSLKRAIASGMRQPLQARLAP